jgi:hypothetical protein
MYLKTEEYALSQTIGTACTNFYHPAVNFPQGAGNHLYPSSSAVGGVPTIQLNGLGWLYTSDGRLSMGVLDEIERFLRVLNEQDWSHVEDRGLRVWT